MKKRRIIIIAAVVMILLLFLVNRPLFMKWMEKDVSVSAEWEDFKGYKHTAVLDQPSISLLNDILKNHNNFDRIILPMQLGSGTSHVKIYYHGKMNSVYDCYGNGMVITRGRFLPIWLSLWKTDDTAKIDAILDIITRNEEGEEPHLSLTEEDIDYGIKEYYEMQVSSWLDDPESGFTEDDFTGASFLSPVCLVSISDKDGSIIQVGSGTDVYIPIVNHDGEIFALYHIVKEQSGINAFLSQSFAYILEEARKAGAEMVYLVNMKGQFGAVTEKGDVFWADKSVDINADNEFKWPDMEEALKYPYTVLDLRKKYER